MPLYESYREYLTRLLKQAPLLEKNCLVLTLGSHAIKNLVAYISRLATFTFDTEWGLPVLSIVIGLTIALIGYFGRRERTDTVQETRLTYMEKEIDAIRKRLDRVYNMLLSNGQPARRRNRGQQQSDDDDDN